MEEKEEIKKIMRDIRNVMVSYPHNRFISAIGNIFTSESVNLGISKEQFIKEMSNIFDYYYDKLPYSIKEGQSADAFISYAFTCHLVFPKF